jgi:hypothetical protein
VQNCQLSISHKVILTLHSFVWAYQIYKKMHLRETEKNTMITWRSVLLEKRSQPITKTLAIP